MANYEATRYDFDGANLTGIEGVNTGLIIPWSSTSVPSGFLECNGTAVSRSTYANLFAVVGTTYGVGDGSTTFNLPDLTDRIPVHKGAGLDDVFASTGGSSTATTVGNVAGNLANTTVSTPEIASHTHNIVKHAPNNPQSSSGAGGNPGVPEATGVSGNQGGGGSHSHGVSANFTGNTFSTRQKSRILLYIIKT